MQLGRVMVAVASGVGAGQTPLEESARQHKADPGDLLGDSASLRLLVRGGRHRHTFAPKYPPMWA